MLRVQGQSGARAVVPEDLPIKPPIFLGAAKAFHMGKIKHSQEPDQVETKAHPATKAAGPVSAVEENAAKPATKDVGLRSQGDVGKQGSKPAAKTEPATAEKESVVAEDGPGNLRSQGAVALTKKTEPAKFSNAHMRAEAAKKAAASKPEPAETEPAAAKNVQASKQLSKGKPPEAEAKAAATVAPKSKAKTEDAAAESPTTALNVEQEAPTISLKVAVQVDEATLVMNPKSKVTLDDVATKEPKPDAKPRKAQRADAPNTGKAAPKPDIGTTKATPAGTPKGAVPLIKKETIKAEPETATSSEGDAPFEDVDLSEAEGDDLQDTTERTQQTGSLSERRHRRTRELRTHKEPKVEPSA